MSSATGTVKGVTPGQSALTSAVQTLASSQGHPVLALISDTATGHSLQQQDVEAVIRLVRRVLTFRLPQLTVLLHANGGDLDAAARLVTVLRSITERLTLVVPARAASSATLLCFAADSIHMGQWAYLTPIDPQFDILLGQQRLQISLRDVKEFPDMARQWFGTDEGDALSLLKLVSEAVAPFSLSHFYRYEKHIEQLCRRVANQGTVVTNDDIERVSQALLYGFGSHAYPIDRDEARQIGLPVSDLDPGVEVQAMACIEAAERAMSASLPTPDDGMVNALVTFSGDLEVLYHVDPSVSRIDHDDGSFTVTRLQTPRWFSVGLDPSTKTRADPGFSERRS